jgi:hypothetical protein
MGRVIAMKKALFIAAGVAAAIVIVALLVDTSPRDLWDDVLDEV